MNEFLIFYLIFLYALFILNAELIFRLNIFFKESTINLISIKPFKTILKIIIFPLCEDIILLLVYLYIPRFIPESYLILLISALFGIYHIHFWFRFKNIKMFIYFALNSFIFEFLDLNIFNLIQNIELFIILHLIFSISIQILMLKNQK